MFLSFSGRFSFSWMLMDLSMYVSACKVSQQQKCTDQNFIKRMLKWKNPRWKSSYLFQISHVRQCRAGPMIRHSKFSKDIIRLIRFPATEPLQVERKDVFNCLWQKLQVWISSYLSKPPVWVRYWCCFPLLVTCGSRHSCSSWALCETESEFVSYPLSSSALFRWYLSEFWKSPYNPHVAAKLS